MAPFHVVLNIGETSLHLSNFTLKKVSNHSKYIKDHVKNMKGMGKDYVAIDIPDHMIEHPSVIHCLVGDFHKVSYSLEELDLVKFLNLCSFLLISEDYLLYIMEGFQLEGNESAVIAIYWAKYRLNYQKVANFLLQQLDIRPSVLPASISYTKYKKKVRNMLRSDARYHTAINFNSTFWPHYVTCPCERCKEKWEYIADNCQEPMKPQYTHSFPAHSRCPLCT